ncbi:MAG: M48 family metallopeptidase [Hyphomicrobiales bacterium]|nr:M48 family metallopeptidase [Hyphomicrobiales bacterium]
MVLTGLILTGFPGPAAAQGQIKLVRDAETEALLRSYATPLVKAARVGSGATRIFLVNNRNFNAFVAGGRNIFVFAGTMMEAKTPNEVIGVLAHEIGHIAGSHIARQQMMMSKLGPVAIAAMLLGAGALAATTRSRNVGGSPIGIVGALTGPQEILRRAMLSHQRSDEQAADIAAVRYLNATRQSSRGLLTTLTRMNRNNMFAAGGFDPYLLSHPLPAERLSYLQEKAHASPYWKARDSKSLQRRHDLARAKLVAFVGDANEVARRYPIQDNSEAAQYARAISAYRFGRLSDALARVDRLIGRHRKNPYYHELKGQALLEGGRANQAIAPLKRSVALAPRATPIRVMLGHALLSSGNPKLIRQSVPMLNRATQQEPENANAFQFLAMAYDRLGNQPMAQLSAAQALFLAGKYVEARTQASRAKRRLKPRSPAWLKADDILSYRPPKYN